MEAINQLNADNKPVLEKLIINVLWQEEKGHIIATYDGSEEEYQGLENITSLAKFGGQSKLKLCKWWQIAVYEQGWGPESPAFQHHTSFIFDNKIFEPEVISAVDQIMEELHGVLSKHDPNGKAYLTWVQVGGKSSKPKAGDTAFYWRDTAYVSYFKLQWYDRQATNAMIDYVRKVREKLVQYTIQHKASYVNFTDSTIPNWQEAYYGENYSRLQEIKQEWDPNNFFHFEQSIELPGAQGKLLYF
ncbi:hypothetical protein RSOLAG1IB_09111 [Rhizoctonia solani AG-1 IB]|uniref:Berberine/berberine-like domain-containing protein n=1 Tax=Thanatephorus cucumeris (strain AG1-IB / isolate 7/3/14) TaxID=1108050 RepID=A0A0B7FQE9_THACB|nr:hypothetical protein RSOLAG1IB_09111 [Rhizoctonia solani AG-1 IB]